MVLQAKTNELRIQADLNLTKRSTKDRTTLCTGFQLFIAYFNTDVSRLVSTYRDKTAWLRIRLADLLCYCADHSQLSQFIKRDGLLACCMQWNTLSKIPRTLNNSFTYLLPVFIKFWNPNSNCTPKLQFRRSQLVISTETQLQSFSDGGNSTVMPYWMLKLPLFCHFTLKSSVWNETRKQLFYFYTFT